MSGNRNPGLLGMGGTTYNYTFGTQTFKDNGIIVMPGGNLVMHGEGFTFGRNTLQYHNNAVDGEILQTHNFTLGRKTLQYHNNAFDGKILQALSQRLGGRWKSLGRRLGIDDATLDSIQNDHGTTQEAAYQMLLHWARLNGRNATIENLAEGLRRAGRTDLAESVEG